MMDVHAPQEEKPHFNGLEDRPEGPSPQSEVVLAHAGSLRSWTFKRFW